MTAPLAHWDDTRARIAAIRAKLPTTSTEDVYLAVTLLLTAVESDIARDGHLPAESFPAYRLFGESHLIACLTGWLGAEVPR